MMLANGCAWVTGLTMLAVRKVNPVGRMFER
jgi:hypothetical protein